MTWPNPPQLPNPPREPITVLVEPCCGVLVGDVCDCGDVFAEVLAAFANPIRWTVTPAGVEAGR